MSIQTVKAIDGIKFCVWSPNEIRKYSVAEITAPETYDEDGMAVQGGLMDGRLGTLEPGQKCLTCGNTSARCPGHFGHIELAEPVLHIAFIDNIHKLLNSKNIHPIRSAEIDDLNLSLNTVLNMDCMAILPENLIKNKVESGELIRIKCDLKALDTQVTAYYKSRFAEKRFEQHLKKL